MPSKTSALICVLLLCLLGCSDPGSKRTDEGEAANNMQLTPAPANTLVPTFTPLPESYQLVTATPASDLPQITAEPTATINFAQSVVQLSYKIPALGLSRRLEGNISGQILVIDETVPLGVQRSNQNGILLDLQRELPTIELQPMPPGCEACVYFKYTLPLEDESREGWLQDPVILASIENYMAAVVGPHFPPETVIGLRREASHYYPAHSIALMVDGRIATWLATEAQVSEPFPSPLPFADILTQLPLTELLNTYAVNCPPEPIEIMRIFTTGEPADITIRCPAYALPTTLLPLYVQLDQLLAAKLATYDGPPRPPTGLPLDAVLDYKRWDGNQLTLSQNGRITIQNNNQIVYTGTMTTTELISLTTDLLNSGQLQPGLTTLLESDAVSSTPTSEATPEAAPLTSFLLVRGPQGLLDGKFDEIDLPFLRDLNDLLDALLTPPEPTETATPDPDSTPGTETDQLTPTPSS